ncbi:hypothetical protein [Alloprevotella tannerae]|uniref:Lipoprotein n=1 Tax=Alloprevotella tannerae TaxID=76122 RepID=A0A929RXZ0_9BACT|nr:hypothetical protein [Alloprevotella tannerae]MBF0969847.1 hypothetical protein [Alloprevotella tannerae]
MRKLLFASASLLSLLIIACLGACDKGENYPAIQTNRDADSVVVWEGMQPDTFYALGYKTFDMKSVAIYKGEKLLTQVTQTAGVYSKDLGEAEFEKDGNIRKLIIYNWCMVERIKMKKGKIGYKVSALGPLKGYKMACSVVTTTSPAAWADVWIK